MTTEEEARLREANPQEENPREESRKDGVSLQGKARKDEANLTEKTRTEGVKRPRKTGKNGVEVVGNRSGTDPGCGACPSARRPDAIATMIGKVVRAKKTAPEERAPKSARTVKRLIRMSESRVTADGGHVMAELSMTEIPPVPETKFLP